MTIKQPAGSQRARGVTLIELVVVLTIIGLISAVTFPAVSAGLDSVRLRSATQSVASFLNAAVARVERSQQPVEVTISLPENLLRLNADGVARELRMPEGITIDATLPAPPEDSGGALRIVLLPGGAYPGIGVRLANQHGGRRMVRLDPMTGFPRVESVLTE